MSRGERLTLTLLPETFALFRMNPDAEVPPKLLERGFFVSITRTADELSIVCPESAMQAGGNKRSGMRVLKVEGPLPFSSVGILRSLLEPLSDSGISALAISTYETDYILVHEDDLERALTVLEELCVLEDA